MPPLLYSSPYNPKKGTTVYIKRYVSKDVVRKYRLRKMVMVAACYVEYAS